MLRDALPWLLVLAVLPFFVATLPLIVLALPLVVLSLPLVVLVVLAVLPFLIVVLPLFVIALPLLVIVLPLVVIALPFPIVVFPPLLMNAVLQELLPLIVRLVSGAARPVLSLDGSKLFAHVLDRVALALPFLTV